MGAWSKPVTVTVTAPEEAAPAPAPAKPGLKQVVLPLGLLALLGLLYKASGG